MYALISLMGGIKIIALVGAVLTAVVGLSSCQEKLMRAGAYEYKVKVQDAIREDNEAQLERSTKLARLEQERRLKAEKQAKKDIETSRDDADALRILLIDQREELKDKCPDICYLRLSPVSD